MTARELKALRKNAGLSRENLARLVPVTLNTYGRWETGKTPITARTAGWIRVVLEREAARRAAEAVNEAEQQKEDSDV